MKRFATTVAFLLAVACLSPLAMGGPAIYELTPFTGYTGINASAINDSGTAVGYCTNSAGALLQAFVWTPTGGMVAIGNQQYARDINNAGQIVGDDNSGNSLYWASSSSSAVTIAAAGTNGGIAKGISDLGQVVGRTGYSVSNPREGYVWDATADGSGSVTTIGGQEANAVNDSGEVVGNQRFRWTASGGMVTIDAGAGDTWGQAFDINSAGTVAGYLGNNTGRFIQTSDGTFTALGTLSSFSGGSLDVSINDLGQVVGDIGYGATAFIWVNGTMTGLNDILGDASWDLKAASDINENGWIIGTGTHDGSNVAYVMVPEPATMSLLAIGGLGVLIRRKRK